MSFANPSTEEIRQLLQTVRSIAVVGLSPNESRPSFGAARAAGRHHRGDGPLHMARLRAPVRMSKDRKRCGWCGGDPLYCAYHDSEWGVPLHDDRALFEFLILEGAQAGLSWITILRKRENYRAAFDGFDAARIARYDANKIESLLRNPGIVRNRLKVEAAVTNARKFLDVREEFGSFDRFIWQFVDGRPKQNAWRSLADIPASTKESDAMSKELKRRGFKFVGSTICYAHMQATGMVNDHITDCFRHKELQ